MKETEVDFEVEGYHRKHEALSGSRARFTPDDYR